MRTCMYVALRATEAIRVTESDLLLRSLISGLSGRRLMELGRRMRTGAGAHTI